MDKNSGKLRHKCGLAKFRNVYCVFNTLCQSYDNQITLKQMVLLSKCSHPQSRKLEAKCYLV